MSSTKIVSLAFLLCFLPQSVQAQPFLYVGTAGFEGHASLCAFAGPCEPTALELYNTATGTAMTSNTFGVAGLGGFGAQSSIVTPDGRRLFAVTRDGLVAVDVLTDRLTLVMGNLGPLAGNATGPLAVSRDGTRVFFATGNTVRVIDAVSLAIIASIPLPASAHDLVRSPEGDFLYATHPAENSVSKISTLSDVIVATFSTPGAAGIGVSPDGARLYVVRMGLQLVTVLDAVTGSTLATVSTTLSVGPWTRGRVAVSPTTAYISGVGASVVFLDVATNTVARTVSVDSPEGLVLGDDNRQLYVASRDGVLVLDAATGAKVGLIRTATAAIDVALVPPTPCLYEVTVAPRVLPVAGGTVEVMIPAAETCSWTVTDSPDWITVGTSSGAGPGSSSLTVAPAAAPRSGTVQVAAQQIRIQQTVPEVHVDAQSGQTLVQPATVTGWAIDRDDNPIHTASAGVDAVHVWAYPLPAGAPIWVGTATYGINRTDVSSLWGLRYRLSGFSATIRGLPAGAYNLVFFAHSARSGTFSAAAMLAATVTRPPAQVVIDTPTPDAIVRGAFNIGGWAIDAAAPAMAGIDMVDVWAYPSTGAAPQYVGRAIYGRARPDVGVAFGDQFVNSGFDLTVRTLIPGRYMLAVFARSNDTGLFNPASVVWVSVAGSDPRMYVDTPAPNAAIDGTFAVGGWALDLAAGNGPGVDAVHIWAYPVGGGAPLFVGAAAPFARPDVAAVFGSEFKMSGFSLPAATLPKGTYDLVVFARSTIAGAFNDTVVVRVTIQ